MFTITVNSREARHWSGQGIVISQISSPLPLPVSATVLSTSSKLPETASAITPISPEISIDAIHESCKQKSLKSRDFHSVRLFAIHMAARVTATPIIHQAGTEWSGVLEGNWGSCSVTLVGIGLEAR